MLPTFCIKVSNERINHPNKSKEPKAAVNKVSVNETKVKRYQTELLWQQSEQRGKEKLVLLERN